MMPTSSTAPISAVRPGLAKKAWMICLYSTTITNAQSTRNTSIRTRKIRGEDSLVSSMSMAEREEPAGILISVAGNRSEATLWHSGGGKKVWFRAPGRGRGRNQTLRCAYSYWPDYGYCGVRIPYDHRVPQVPPGDRRV